MLENIEQVIRDYLPQIIHLSLGTSKENKPWVCEVTFAYDDNLNLYFRSRTTTRHCQEIAENKLVSGSIVTQHVGEEKPRGIYFEGECEMVNDSTVSKAIETYIKRFSVGNESMEAKNRDPGHRFYVIKVSKFFVFDARESQPPHKYELEWGK
ncbi:MAG: pyridoxamine 5'-phosphate oxidase family protein [Candidatus Dojkabacteria bacterium]